MSQWLVTLLARPVPVALLKHNKANSLGIKVVYQPVHGTSSHCPRCGKKGDEIERTSQQDPVGYSKFKKEKNIRRNCWIDFTGFVKLQKITIRLIRNGSWIKNSLNCQTD
ncbi:MAG: zinc ribbon domain-containing protein [Candidatus Odinarchaeota archaeon]